VRTKDRREPIAALGGLSAEEFLRGYWQKRPLLVRGAFRGFRDPLTRDELAGLACEPDVESRLVLEHGGGRPWQVVRGPQNPARLRRLPRSHWTLLVEGADRRVCALADLLDAFAFLPHWRLDDVMVSFAAPQGTVGPHVDRYDVFLLQGQGHRRWQVDPKALDVCLPGLDLRVLRSFEASEEWLLERGDLLYLPPGLAHFGVAQDECLTYSIGFRAPRISELLFGLLERLARHADPSALYEDPDLDPQAEPGEIAPQAISRLLGLVETAWNEARGRLPVSLGEILTVPAGAGPEPRARGLSGAEVEARLGSGSGLVRNASSRVSYLGGRQRTRWLFADGRAYPLPLTISGAAPLLTRGRRISGAELAGFLHRRGFLALLAALVNAGTFALERPRRPGASRAAVRAGFGSPQAKGSRSRGAGRSGGGGARGGKRGA
jgi:50S ribosomal protein L16 3-hydroxylase